jgi:hypothetical protein
MLLLKVVQTMEIELALDFNDVRNVNPPCDDGLVTMGGGGARQLHNMNVESSLKSFVICSSRYSRIILHHYYY